MTLQGPLTTEEFEFEESDRIKARADGVQRVSRADVARFMLDTAEEGIQNNELKNKRQIAVSTKQ